MCNKISNRKIRKQICILYKTWFFLFLCRSFKISKRNQSFSHTDPVHNLVLWIMMSVYPKSHSWLYLVLVHENKQFIQTKTSKVWKWQPLFHIMMHAIPNVDCGCFETTSFDCSWWGGNNLWFKGITYMHTQKDSNIFFIKSLMHKFF